MLYLAILVVVAIIGITKLYLQQRKERSHIQTVDGFRTSLQRLSDGSVTAPGQGAAPPPAAAEPEPAGSVEPEVVAFPEPVRTLGSRRSHPVLDPARRAAAKRRIEERRRAARARAAGV